MSTVGVVEQSTSWPGPVFSNPIGTNHTSTPLMDFISVEEITYLAIILMCVAGLVLTFRGSKV